MKKSRFTEEQIALALRQAEVRLADGLSLTPMCRQIGSPDEAHQK